MPVNPQVGLGQRLRRARECLLPSTKNGYRAVARAVGEVDPDASGADHSSVKKYEEGRQEPGARYLMAFCRVTGCSASWLLLNIGPMKIEDQAVQLGRYGLMEQVLAGEMDDKIAGTIDGKGAKVRQRRERGEKIAGDEATRPSE